jgi:hypothetical protein
MAGSLRLSDEGSRWLILGPTAAALHAAVLGFAMWGSGSDLDRASEPSSPVEFAVELPTGDSNSDAPAAAETASPSLDRPASDNEVPTQLAAPKTAVRPTSALSLASSKRVAELPAESPSDLRTASEAAQLGSRDGNVNAEIAGAGTEGNPAMGSDVGSQDAGTHAHDSRLVRMASVARPAPASRPRLLSSASTCQGVLANAAAETPARVTVVLQVNADGTASPKSVQTDAATTLPGLKAAVHTCARRLRFAPAQTETGERIQAASTIRLTIGGHYSAHAPNLGRKRQNHI